MNNEDKINVDLEVVSLINDLKNRSITDEAVFYCRKKDGRLFVGFYGEDEDLVNSFVITMSNHEGFYGIISAAVCLFEEDSLCIIEDELDTTK